MTLRELIKNASKESKDRALRVLNDFKYHTLIAQDSDGFVFCHLTYGDENINFDSSVDMWCNWLQCEVIFSPKRLGGTASDHSTTILTRDEVIKLLYN